jgi:hypothetical protein
MPAANVAARSITKIEIGVPELNSRRALNNPRIDVTGNFISLEVGFESYQQGTGLLLIKGSLVISENTSSDNLTPSNPSFATGNGVLIDMEDAEHPLASILFILSTPTMSPTFSGGGLTPGNRTLTIDLGCRLSRYRASIKPDSEATRVVLGSSLSVKDVCKNLLIAGGIPANNPSIFDMGLSDARVSFPYSKNGGSFVDLAGEFAYSSKSNISLTRPMVLYTDRGTIKDFCIPDFDTVASSISLTLGKHDRAFAWQPDTSAAPGIVTVDAVQRIVVDDNENYPHSDTIVDSDGSSSETTYYKYEFVEGDVFDEVFPAIEIFDIIPYNISFEVKPVSVKAYSGFTSIQTQTNVENFGLTATVETGKEYNFSFFNGVLTRQVTARWVRAETLYPSGWEDDTTSLPSGLAKDPPVNIPVNEVAETYKDTVIPSEVTIVAYEYSGFSVSKITTLTVSNYFLIDKAGTFADNFEWAFNDASIPGEGEFLGNGGNGGNEERQKFNMVVKVFKEEYWKSASGSWYYTIKDFAPAIINNPTISDKEFDVKLALQPKPLVPFVSTSKSTKNTPPGPQIWEGRYFVVERNVSGSASFGTGYNDREVKMQMPFAFVPALQDQNADSIQPRVFARIEGQILVGRQYQFLVECSSKIENYDLKRITTPLYPINVVELDLSSCPSAAFAIYTGYLMDAFTWYHTRDECYVAFAGIYVKNETYPMSSACAVFDPFDTLNPAVTSPLTQPEEVEQETIEISDSSGLTVGDTITVGSFGTYTVENIVDNVITIERIDVVEEETVTVADTSVYSLGETILIGDQEQVILTIDSPTTVTVGNASEIEIQQVTVADSGILSIGDRIDVGGRESVVLSIDSSTQVTAAVLDINSAPSGTVISDPGTINKIVQLTETNQESIVSPIPTANLLVGGFILKDLILGSAE